MEQRELVTLEIEEKMAIITIDNPPVNALTKTAMDELQTVLFDLRKSKRVRVVIITGTGEKAFVAGADIKQFTDLDYQAGVELVSVGQEIFNEIEALDIPVLCAMNGLALGAGCELALACDIRIAEEHIKIGLPEVSLGIIPGYGGTQRLPRLIGMGKAKEMIYSGEPLRVEEAYAFGLVERIVPKGESLQHAKQLAKKIITRAPLAVSKAKKSINEGIELSLKDGLGLEAELFGQLCNSKDKNEGAQAFLNKREPRFIGQ